MAKSNLMIDNSKTRVTMWSFEIDDETGQHIHEYDYVIVPMLDGALKIVDKDGSVSISNLKKGECYFREKGVNHNVINNNKFPYSFIEVEIKTSILFSIKPLNVDLIFSTDIFACMVSTVIPLIIEDNCLLNLFKEAILLCKK